MNRLLLEPRELQQGRAVVNDRRARHIVKVLRLVPGDSLRVGVIGGGVGSATVVRVETAEIELEVGPLGEVPPRPGVDIVIAMPRPRSLARVLESAAAIGVGRIDVVNAWRVDKSYFASSVLEPQRCRQRLLLGCEQGGTTWLPQFHVHRLFMPFVDEQLTKPDKRQRLLAHPRDAAAIERVATSASRQLIAFGPDGGWTDGEVDTFVTHGFQAVQLTDGVLRTDHAVIAALAQLEVIRRVNRAEQ